MVDVPQGAFMLERENGATYEWLTLSCNGCGASVFSWDLAGREGVVALSLVIDVAGRHIGRCPILRNRAEVLL